MIPLATSLESDGKNGLKAIEDKPNTSAQTAGKKCQSRHELLNELESLGVNTEALSPLHMDTLEDLLNGFHTLMNAKVQSKGPGRPRHDANTIVLTSVDKTILRHLFASQGHVSSLRLSRELNIPLSTIQRRRKRLQDTLIETRYCLRAQKLGWRNASLYVSSASGQTEVIGKEILDMSEMVYCVTRMLGDNSFDLRIDVMFKTMEDLTLLIDKIKSKEGVRGVIWSESLKKIGEKEVDSKMISSF